MPFIGGHKEPQAERAGCKTPRWTFLIPTGALWKCRACKSTYRLDRNEWAMDCVEVKWVDVSGEVSSACTSA